MSHNAQCFLFSKVHSLPGIVYHVHHCIIVSDFQLHCVTLIHLEYFHYGNSIQFLNEWNWTFSHIFYNLVSMRSFPNKNSGYCSVKKPELKFPYNSIPPSTSNMFLTPKNQISSSLNI